MLIIPKKKNGMSKRMDTSCHDIHVQNLGQTWKFLLKENFSGHPLAGPLWESQFEEVLLELGWEKVPCWER